MFKEALLDELEIKAKQIGFDEIGLTDLNNFEF